MTLNLHACSTFVIGNWMSKKQKPGVWKLRRISAGCLSSRHLTLKAFYRRDSGTAAPRKPIPRFSRHVKANMNGCGRPHRRARRKELKNCREWIPELLHIRELIPDLESFMVICGLGTIITDRLFQSLTFYVVQCLTPQRRLVVQQQLRSLEGVTVYLESRNTNNVMRWPF
ncbi:hypothetical protein B0H19DRAFT_1064318 [Mycena capillaripes]|nr:hypothetical protein B0H19DRAFT_1064318 [Mycena capillaripes]